jgi:hypothetical protein
MNARHPTSSLVLRLLAVAPVVALAAAEAQARPGDRIAARRLSRLLPPGSVVVVPRPDEIPVAPLPPRQARRLARKSGPLVVQPPAPAVVGKPATPLVTTPAPVVVPPQPGFPANVPPAVAAQPPLVRQAVPATPVTPAPPAAVVDRAGGVVPAASPAAAQTGAWTLAPDAAAADGTQSVLVPESPAERVELLPTPEPTPAPVPAR